jgi:hypothetical protein
MLRGHQPWRHSNSTLELLNCPHNGTEVPCDPAVISPFVQLDLLHERTVPLFPGTGAFSVIFLKETYFIRAIRPGRLLRFPTFEGCGNPPNSSSSFLSRERSSNSMSTNSKAIA